MLLQRMTIEVQTNSGGSATVHSDGLIYGLLYSISYRKDGTDPYDNGVDFSIATSGTVETIWAESNVDNSKTVYPRVQVHGTDGAPADVLTGVPMTTLFLHARSTIAITVTNGGNEKVGHFDFLIMTDIDLALLDPLR